MTMLMITTCCDHPACKGSVRFTHERSERKPRRRLGTCDICGATHGLYAGQVRPLCDLLPDQLSVDQPAGSMPQSLAS